MGVLHFFGISLSVYHLVLLFDSNVLSLRSVVLFGLMHFIANWLTVFLNYDCDLLLVVAWCFTILQILTSS